MHHDRLRLDARVRRADAVAQSQHGNLVMSRLDDLGALLTADPSWNHDRLGMYVFEAVALHFRERPLDGSRELRSAAQAVSNPVCQFREAAPGKRVDHGCPDQARRRFPVRLQPARRCRALGGRL